MIINGGRHQKKSAIADINAASHLRVQITNNGISDKNIMHSIEDEYYIVYMYNCIAYFYFSSPCITFILSYNRLNKVAITSMGHCYVLVLYII